MSVIQSLCYTNICLLCLKTCSAYYKPTKKTCFLYIIFKLKLLYFIIYLTTNHQRKKFFSRFFKNVFNLFLRPNPPIALFKQFFFQTTNRVFICLRMLAKSFEHLLHNIKKYIKIRAVISSKAFSGHFTKKT